MKTAVGPSAVILAGGRSSRMGFPKYLAEIEDKTILGRELEVLSGIFEEIIVVSDDSRRFESWPGVAAVDDLMKKLGPIGGLHAGLRAASGDSVFLFACDMPFLEAGLITELIGDFRDDECDCCVPLGDKGLEPLHALYSKRMLPAVEAGIAAGELSIRRLFEITRCKIVDWSRREISSFVNINTPEELRRHNRGRIAAAST